MGLDKKVVVHDFSAKLLGLNRNLFGQVETLDHVLRSHNAKSDLAL